MSVLVGLQDLYYAKLTKDDETGVMYDTPKRLAKAIEASINPNSSKATLYADNGPAETATSLGEIEVSLGIDQIGTAEQADLLGNEVDANGALIKTTEDEAPYVAIGFRGTNHDGSDKLVWLYKGKFQENEQSYATKGENVEFQTPTISATFIRRDFDKAWQYQLNSGDEGANATVAKDFFTKVQEKATAPTV
ncbi:major tail protein [Pseudobacillus badius]|uniref:major tail protein n=1 Tax=Bacillus badius TaxID=1455 RepID=UPI0007B38105|nr:major tail protein [Bacillus badius]KZR60387.1 hypothetical protein A3781_09450 [Bacillus badius]